MARRTEHSKLGGWSLGLSLFFSVVFLLGLAGLRFMQSAGYVEDTGTPPQLAILLVLAMLTCLLFVLVAVVLGVAGYFSEGARSGTRYWEPSSVLWS